MAHIQEVMATGVTSTLARMLGSNRLRTVVAAGSVQDDATPLVSNFCLLACSVPGQGVRLNRAREAAITALFAIGPDSVLIYPAEDEAINNLAADQPVVLQPGSALLAVPSRDHWLMVLSAAEGGIADAPVNGGPWAREGGAWVELPPPLPDGPPGAVLGFAAGGAATPSAALGAGRLLEGGGTTPPTASATWSEDVNRTLAANLNAVAAPGSSSAEPGLYIAGPNGSGVAPAPSVSGDGIQAPGLKLIGRRSEATMAVPAGPLDNTSIISMLARGYTGAGGAWGTADQAAVTIGPAESWAVGANGAKVRVYATQRGTTALAQVAAFQSDGTLYLGASTSSSANNTGAGTVNVAGDYYRAGVKLGIAAMGDAAIATPANRDLLTWDTASLKWINLPAAGYWVGTDPTGTVDQTAGLQAYIDAAYTAGRAVTLGPGTWSVTGIKIYNQQQLNFWPGAVLRMTAAGACISTWPSPAAGTQGPLIGGITLNNPVINMNSRHGVAILVEGTWFARIMSPNISNVPAGTWTHSDGVVSGGTYPNCGIMIKGISGVAGAYYNQVVNPIMMNGSGQTGYGIWLGTSAGTSVQKANVSKISGGYISHFQYGIYVSNGNDGIVEYTDLSLNYEGIILGNDGSAVVGWVLRNLYLESETNNIGIHFAAGSSFNQIDSVASTSGTTVPVQDDSTVANSASYVWNTRIVPATVSGELQLTLTGPATGGFTVANVNTQPVILGSRFNGAPGTLTPVLAGQKLADFGGGGYNGSAPSRGSYQSFTASENWSSSTTGADLRFYTIPTGSAALTQRAILESDGTLYVGSSTSLSANNTGAGTVNCSDYYRGGLKVSPGTGAQVQGTTASPGGTTATAGIMLGLNRTITPVGTTRFLAIINGDVLTTGGAGNGAATQLRWGTGTPPINGAALTGSAFGGRLQYIAAAPGQKSPFSVMAIVSGLTPGTPYWVDAELAVLGTGTASAENLGVTIFEF